MQNYKHYTKIANRYFNNKYYNQWTRANSSSIGNANDIFDDPYLEVNDDVPERPLVQNWTLIRTDSHIFRKGIAENEPFVLYMDEVRKVMGKTDGIQVRIEAWMTEYFYNETQSAFAETRIISKKVGVAFLGPQPMVFKPGMPLEGQLRVCSLNMIS